MSATVLGRYCSDIVVVVVVVVVVVDDEDKKRLVASGGHKGIFDCDEPRL